MIRVNDQMKFIFQEAMKDCRVGSARGNHQAVTAYNMFNRFNKMRRIQLSDLDFLYSFYKKQVDDLAGKDDPRLNGLKTEVGYIWNWLHSHFDFKEGSGILSVTMKDQSEAESDEK